MAVVLIFLTTAAWRAFARAPAADWRAQRLAKSLDFTSALLTSTMVVLALANTTTAVNSPRALLSLYNGGF